MTDRVQGHEKVLVRPTLDAGLRRPLATAVAHQEYSAAASYRKRSARFMTGKPDLSSAAGFCLQSASPRSSLGWPGLLKAGEATPSRRLTRARTAAQLRALRQPPTARIRQEP